MSTETPQENTSDDASLKQKAEEMPTETPKEAHRSHTYEDDVAQAMTTTDAVIVQELIATAREREDVEKDRIRVKKQRGLYSFFSTVLVLLAVVGAGYAVYHYNKLTVQVEKKTSVGVFASTDPVIASTTDIRQTILSLQASDSLKEGKPMLVPIVKDDTTLIMLGKQEFFDFIESNASEPFVAAVDVIRLGMFDEGKDRTPFIILSVPDPEVASKEFLIAEDDLLTMFYRPLGIDLSKYVDEIGKGFESTYMYNVPVRSLTSAKEDADPETVLLYGYVNDNTIVITTKASVLKAVYDTIIRQH